MSAGKDIAIAIGSKVAMYGVGALVLYFGAKHVSKKISEATGKAFNAAGEYIDEKTGKVIKEAPKAVLTNLPFIGPVSTAGFALYNYVTSPVQSQPTINTGNNRTPGIPLKDGWKDSDSVDPYTAQTMADLFGKKLGE